MTYNKLLKQLHIYNWYFDKTAKGHTYAASVWIMTLSSQHYELMTAKFKLCQPTTFESEKKFYVCVCVTISLSFKKILCIFSVILYVNMYNFIRLSKKVLNWFKLNPLGTSWTFLCRRKLKLESHSFSNGIFDSWRHRALYI